MTYLMHAGGAPMWLVLLFGIIAMAAAAFFAWRPDETKIGFIRAMSTTTVFLMVAGFAAGMAMTLHRAAHLPAVDRGDWPVYLMIGSSESLSAIILGGTLLALVWLITAIGFRRLGRFGG